MKREKAKIKYGKVDLGQEYFEPANQKVRITTFVDGDVLQWLKESSAKSGRKYQTLLNDLLRSAMGNSKATFFGRVDVSKLEPALREQVSELMAALMKQFEQTMETKLEEREHKIEKKIERLERAVQARPHKRA